MALIALKTYVSENLEDLYEMFVDDRQSKGKK
jgi:hypothetical protein